jgi:hypothetical protein
MGKEVAVAQYEVLCWHFSGGTKGNHESLGHDSWPYGQRFEPATFKIRIYLL